MTAPIDFICVRRDHYQEGLGRADGSGHYTLHRDRWAYCAAGKPTEEHTWKATGGVAPDALRHEIDWLTVGPRDEQPPDR